MNKPVENQDRLIQQVAAAALGASDGAAPADASAQPDAQPNLDTSKPAPDTTVGNAEAQGSPDTEGDKMAEDAIIYEIKRPDGNTEKLTPQQILSTFDRYRALNYQNAQMKPVLDVVGAYLRNNPNENPKTVARKLLDLARGQSPQPQFGADAERAQEKRAETAPTDVQALQRWAEENALNSLPPGYEDMFTNVQRTQQQMQQMMQMMQRMMGAAQGMTQATAASQRQQGQNQQALVSQQIANNLDRVQAALKLPDEAANDFMMFAAERGYTKDDFIDINLTAKVMKDFANTLASPEMERIREIAKRRQAFTSGGIGATPTAGGATSGPSEETPLDRLTQSVMAKRAGV